MPFIYIYAHAINTNYAHYTNKSQRELVVVNGRIYVLSSRLFSVYFKGSGDLELGCRAKKRPHLSVSLIYFLHVL